MSRRFSRRDFLKTSAYTAGAVAAGPTILSSVSKPAWASGSGPIPVGVLYSLTGTTAIVEESMHDCALMAIEEINNAGGVLGRELQPVVEDPASDPDTYSRRARSMLLRDDVASIFGCYTTASRLAVKPQVERQNNLLVWPTWYEGEECSKNIFYAGSAVPNQQLENSIPYMVNELGVTKLFIVGSDYAFPRGMGRITREMVEDLGAEYVGDEYLPLGHMSWSSLVRSIRQSGADGVFSNVVGDSIVAFYREFLNQGLDFHSMPLCSSTTTEIEISAMGAQYAEGSYISLPYFQTVDTPENERFVQMFREYKQDDSVVTHAAMESVYIGVHLWAQAAEAAGEADPVAIREALETEPLSMDAPQGKVTVDPQNLHTHLTPRIGQVQPDGQLAVIEAYDEPLVPLPYSAHGETEDNRICTLDGSTI